MKNTDTSGSFASAWNKARLSFKKPQNKEYRLVDNWLQLLLIDPEKRLLRDIKNIRKKFNIPKLDALKDNLESNDLLSNSRWVLSECKNQKLFLKKVDELVDQYDLPSYLAEWLEYYILYDLVASTPFFDHYLELDFLQNPEKYKEIGLTPKEKAGIIFYYKQQPKKEGVSKEEVNLLTLQLEKFLSKIKDKPRVVKITKNDIKILKSKNSSKMLTNKIYDQDMSPGLEESRAGAIRKRRNRLLKLLESRIKPRKRSASISASP